MDKKSVLGVVALVAALGAVGIYYDRSAPEDDLSWSADEDQTAGDAESLLAGADEDEAPDTDEDQALGTDADSADDPEGDQEEIPELAGDQPPVNAASHPVRRSPTAPARIRFVPWHEARGLISTEVPQGWRIESQIGSALELGQFMIEGFSPNGDAMFALAHNWLSFMEAQYGRYRPGAATLETLVIPDMPKTVRGLREIRTVYRGPSERTVLPNPASGMSIQTDRGVLGLAGYSRAGQPVAGLALGETLYIPVPGTPGLWRLRLFVAGIAPAQAERQAEISAIQRHVFQSLQLSDQFKKLWQEGFQHSVQIMQEYSRDMDRVFDSYLSSTARSASPDNDPVDGWAEMMRGGHYERDEGTGEDHWVSNNHKYWWKNDRGAIFGNDTGTPPLHQGNVHALTRP